ncbi:ABC transporter ATP-binding protein [Heliorestis acidaminivorans]|uniref:ABC transporter ATP-binding protein n=1 Tax=Heliorestis acidaminivorans TaxID=553427 RepID=A0A6I0F3X1_9FIRM|nr:ABC transporter ATP-binding protein [Heliorestis acidaminivorans]KAB2954213.1 ABC transporter ATP-binding protein [Heliorestis acidaminivorans]
MERATVQFDKVTKKIGKKTIIDEISFSIAPGEVFGLLGPNGAGKTTALRMLTGLMKPTKGDIRLCGYSIQKDFEKAIQHVGAIIENPDLYSYLTGYQNLIHFARMSGKVNKERLTEIIALVGLAEAINDKVKTYSLGMRQRLGLAQALLHSPSLVVLDEPTNGLDPAGIGELRQYLKKIAHDEGVTVLVSSHLLSEMELLCDGIAIIQKGKILQIQKMQDIVKNSTLEEHFLEVTDR